MLRAAVLAALFALALAFQAPAVHTGLRGRVRAKARLGACQPHMRADRHSSSLQALQALHRRAVLQLPAMAVLAAPLAAQAKEKKKGGTQAGEAAKYESISLDDFYAALEDQEVLKVEFDGPKFEVGDPDFAQAPLLRDRMCAAPAIPRPARRVSAICSLPGRARRGRTRAETCGNCC